MDVKCPGSGESDKNDWSNLALLTKTDEVKFVIADRRDYEFAKEIVQREHLPARVNAVLFSPVHGELDPKQLSEWVIADRLDVRVQLQVHKYIWSPGDTWSLTGTGAGNRELVVLLSGGLDSYTAAAVAKRDGFALYALSINYGQRHAQELDAARAVATRAWRGSGISSSISI